MATAGKVNGNLLLIYMEGEAIACTTEATVNITNEQIEVTCKDNDGAKSYTLGGQDWNFTVGGIFSFDNNGIDPLLDVALGKTVVTVRFGTDEVGDFFLQGEAVITSLSITSPLNAVATYTATFQSNGPLSKGINT